MAKMMVIIAVIIGFLLVGCTASKSFVVSIEAISEDAMKVNCSEEVIKGRKSGNSPGYVCTVHMTEDTLLTNSDKEELSIEDFSKDASIRVMTDKRINIKKVQTFVAKEIVFIEQ